MSRDFVDMMMTTTTMTLIVQVRTLVQDTIGDGSVVRDAVRKEVLVEQPQ